MDDLDGVTDEEEPQLRPEAKDQRENLNDITDDEETQLETEAKAEPQFPSKCRGHYDDLTPEQRAEVEKRCHSREFSTACMLMPREVLEANVAKLREVTTLPPEFSIDDIFQSCATLDSVIRKDKDTLRETGMTHVQLGDALKTVARLAVHKADKHFGGAMASMLARLMGNAAERPDFETPFAKLIRVDPQWCDQGEFESIFDFNGQRLRVFVILWGGSQRCPFQHPDDKHYHGYSYGARDVVVTNLDNEKTLRYSTLLPHMIKHHGFLEGPFCFYRVNPVDVREVLGSFEAGKSYAIKSEGKGKEKRYLWSEWLPDQVDGTKNKVAADAERGRAMVLRADGKLEEIDLAALLKK